MPQQITSENVSGGANPSPQKGNTTSGADFMSFLATEQRRAGSVLSYQAPSSPTTSQQGAQSSQGESNPSDNAGPKRPSITLHRKGQKTDDQVLSQRPDYHPSGSPVIADITATVFPTIIVTELPATPTDAVEHIPELAPQVLTSPDVPVSITTSGDPGVGPAAQQVTTGQSVHHDPTTRPSAVFWSAANDATPSVPSDIASPDSERRLYPDGSTSLRQVDTPIQHPGTIDNNSSYNEPLLHTAARQVDQSVTINNDVTDAPVSPNAAQATFAQRDIQIPQPVGPPVLDVAKAHEVGVADHELLAKPRISEVAPGKILPGDLPLVLLSRHQIAARPNNVTPVNTPGDISPSPGTVTLSRAISAPDMGQLSNTQDGQVRLRMDLNAGIVSDVKITTQSGTTSAGMPIADALPTAQHTESQLRNNAVIIGNQVPEEALRQPQIAYEPRVMPDQINGRQNVREEIPLAENVKVAVYEKAPEMEQRLEATQVNGRQNVWEEMPIAGNAKVAAYEKSPEMEQRLEVARDVPTSRQNMPEAQGQSQATHEQRVLSGQMSRYENTQAVNEVAIPNVATSPQERARHTRNAAATDYSGASGNPDRAQVALQSSISGTRPEMVKNIAGDTSNNGVAVEHIQGDMGMQNKGGAGHDAQGRNTPQNAEDQVSNIIHLRTPEFDGSQFMIPRADAEFMPLYLGSGTGGLTANEEAQTTSSLSALPDRISTYVHNMDTRDGSSSIEIQLEPKHLGKIKFKVSLKDNKISAELSVSLSQTKEIIEMQLQDIRKSLAQHEIEVIELSVSLENESLESSPRHSGLFRNQGSGFKETHSSADYEQEEERESSEQENSRNNALVDLLI